MRIAPASRGAGRPGGGAGRGHRALRSRADGDRRLPDLARVGAPGDPLADRRHRRWCGRSGSPGRCSGTWSAWPPTTSRSGRWPAHACGRTSGWSRSHRRSSRGTATATCCRGWWRTSTRCRTCTCAVSTRRWSPCAAGTVSVVAAAAFVLPASAAVLAVGLVAAAIAAPAVAVAAGRRERSVAGPGQGRADRRDGRAAARQRRAGRLRMRGVPPASGCATRPPSWSRLARTAALGDGAGDALRLAITGLTVAGVLATAVSAHSSGRLDGPMIALLGLLALASFEAVQPLPQAARALGETLAAGRRLLELTGRRPAVSDPVDPAPLPAGPLEVALEHVRVRLAPGEPLGAGRRQPAPGAGAAGGAAGPSGVGKSTIANLLLRFVDPEAGPGDAGRPRPPGLPPGGRPPGDRRGQPGHLSVLDQHHRERPAGAAGGERRRGR